MALAANIVTVMMSAALLLLATYSLDNVSVKMALEVEDVINAKKTTGAIHRCNAFHVTAIPKARSHTNAIMRPENVSV